MAYCRFSEGDVYLIGIAPGPDTRAWECIECCLTDDKANEYFESPLDVLKHLKAHRKAGNEVPPPAMDRVRSDVCEYLPSHPTPDNIRFALRQLFDAVGFIDDLDLFFSWPADKWQADFLDQIETVNIPAVYSDGPGDVSSSVCLEFLKHTREFVDRNRVLSIVSSWQELVSELPEPDLDDAEERSPEMKLWNVMFAPLFRPDKLIPELRELTNKAIQNLK